jgi:hypothetical protein
MIEIKSRWNDRVLYTAKDAKDVRAAVEEAVRRDANLTCAYLTDANLTCAYLTDAYLTDANLTCANLTGANLTGANLTGANLTCANLTDANLTDANLTDANLTCANLTGANLRGANLTCAYLTGANLRDAKGLAPERHNALLLLKDQVGKIRAYKLVTADLQSPLAVTKLTYEIGSTVKAKASTDEAVSCAEGVSLATLPWCLREWRPGQRILVCEFTAEDIAAIPHTSDGKFRVHRAKVIREVDIEAIFAKEQA